MYQRVRYTINCRTPSIQNAQIDLAEVARCSLSVVCSADVDWWWLLPRVRGCQENVRQFIFRLRFVVVVVVVCSEMEISSRKLIPLFGQDQSTVAQRAETTVTECSLMSCV